MVKTSRRLALYRKRHRRFDFYASPDVADIIAPYQVNGREKCLAGILDGLIRAGHKAFSGNKCRHLIGRGSGSRRCANRRVAGVAIHSCDAQLPADVVNLLHRCEGFKISRPPTPTACSP